jgi:hypothetical protein
MSKKHLVFAFTLISTASYQLFAQGCSDAGFCTLNATKPFSWDTIPSTPTYNSLKLGFSAGRADYDIQIFSSYLEYSRSINDHVSVDFKVTALSQKGPTHQSLGLSDVFVTTNYKWFNNTVATLGLKIPLNDGNTIKSGNGLPLDYQTSLGTLDFIAGYGFHVRKLQLVAAGQFPLTQNKNQFLATDFTSDSPFSKFPSTHTFKRRPDVLLRLSYPLSLSHSWTLTPGILPIYHIGEDQYTDENGDTKAITGSSGLTLNTTVFLSYQTKKGNRFEFNAGTPLIAREVRPDGLTRKFIATVEYKIRF